VNGGGRFHELTWERYSPEWRVEGRQGRQSGDWRSRVKRRGEGLAFGEDVLWNFAEFAHRCGTRKALSARRR